MRLVYYPNPGLSIICKPAPDQSHKERAKIAADIWKIMKDNHGAGLAANQVGLDIQMFTWMEDGLPQIIWNPELSCLGGCLKRVEGCLSLPKINVTMERATSSILFGQGINGIPVKYVGNIITTRIWQHEIDHLQGILIIDNMNRNETISNRKVMKKLLKKVIA